MDFTDEEREVLFKSSMDKLQKAIWDLSIGNGNNRDYNGIYEYFVEIYGDGSFNGRDRTLADFSAWMEERKTKLEKAKELLARAEQYFVPSEDKDSLCWKTALISLKRRLAIIEAENDCGNALIQLAADVGKAMTKDFNELSCREIVDYIEEASGYGSRKRQFWR